jgi:Superfamily II DNA/RNA helicases, SNF2 family
LSIPEPYQNQIETAKFLSDRPRAFDLSDCGTGKTRSEIEAYKASARKCALVVAPRSILQPAWGDDLAAFAPEIRYSIAYAENREEAFQKEADFYITNHDATKWLAKQSPKFFERFSDLIIDESTAFKHHTSKRSKALAKIAKYFPVRRLMTATPNPNSITDIWHQAFILDGGKRLGPSFYAFRNATCTPIQNGPASNMLKWEDREGAELAVTGLLADISIRHLLEDCTDIPPNHEYTRNYYLPTAHYAQYRKLEETSILAIKDRTVNAVNGAVLLNKLLQVASGAVYDDSGGYSVLDTGRYELVLDLVEERRQSVVFFTWEHQRRCLVEEAEKRGLSYAVIDGENRNINTKNEIVRNFQKGFYRVLFIHPQSGAHGLTLTAAKSTIWASPTYNLEHYHQGKKRIHRAGQTEKTETIVIVAPHTADEQAYAACLLKQTRMGDLLHLLAEAPR